MIEFIKKFWLQTAMTGILLFVSTTTKILFGRFKAEFEEQDKIKDGVLALLHDRLYQACHYYLTLGHITVSQLNNIEQLYINYHNLGGNGTGTELFNRCKSLPIKQEEP